jgi:HEPN domain-containing protein
MAGFIVNNLYAQHNQRAIREFHELKNYLAKIWVVVQQFDNAQAHNLMAQARQELDIAEDLIFNQGKYVEARVHIFKARTLGNQAANIVLNQPINRLKKQLDDIINRSETFASDMHSDEVRYLLNQAKKFRKLAYDALAAGRINKAQEYYRIAFYFADKSLILTNRNDKDLETQIAELKSNIDLLFTQAEEIISGDNRKRFNNLLNEAKKHYTEVINLLETDRVTLALKRLRLIEKLLYRIIDRVDRTSLNQKDRIENELYSMQAFLEAFESDVEENSNQRVKMFLDRAKNQYIDATNAYESGDIELAKNKINLCQRFASKAMQFIKTGSNYNVMDIESQLNDNIRLLELQKPKVEQSNNNSIKKLHQEAEMLTYKALELYEQNNRKYAFQHLQLSMRLMNRIQRQLEYSNMKNNVDKNEIRNRLKRVQTVLTKLEKNPKLQTQFQNELQQLTNLYNQVEIHIENQNYEIANEYIDYLFQQINVKSNEWSQKTE